MEKLYEELSKNILGISNDIRSNPFIGDELYDELNPKSVCRVNQIPPSLNVFDKKTEQNTSIHHLN